MSLLLSSTYTKKVLLDTPCKKIIISGPSGFLGSRVLESILEVQQLRQKEGLNPGEVILLSSSPGRLMERLYKKYGPVAMQHARASRVDYYKQHDVDTWIDQLGSLGVEGDQAVFVNLAAVAGPVDGFPDGMMDVNYRAPLAAAKACETLGVSHWVQSSTQATNAERAGQVPYSRGKAMIDYALSRCKSMPVSVACLGLLYSKADGIIGQERTRGSRVNLIDLSLLPLTPIMGNGSAPLQPQEVTDASARLAYLALTDTTSRPRQFQDSGTNHRNRTSNTLTCSISHANRDVHSNTHVVDEHGSAFAMPRRANTTSSSSPLFNYYDAVGPETMTMMDMLRIFAKAQGNDNFRPVFIGYRNMEKLLNIRSLGNLNRQFVSLLRSEQDSHSPIIGDHSVWEKLLGPDVELQRLEHALVEQNETNLQCHKKRRFPFGSLIELVMRNPKVIYPGMLITLEVIDSFLSSRVGSGNSKP